MVESEANELPEDVMLGAVVFGHEQMQAVINLINELADEAGKPDVGLDAAGEGPGAHRAHGADRRKRAAPGLSDPRQAGAHAPRSTRFASACMTELASDGGDARAAHRARRRVQQSRSEDRPQPDPRRRAAHRRPRHAHRAADHDPHRRAAARSRLGALHARRDAGDRDARRSAPRATSRSSTRCRANIASAS